jgi:hypothetical protein
MLRILAAALAFLTLPASGALAQQTAGPVIGAPQTGGMILGDTQRRKMLGYGRLTTNDIIGDGKDRWRTGSVTSSRTWGYGWDGTAPGRLGQLLELRFQGQIIAPQDLQTPGATDRPYAGALSFGLHTHATLGGAEIAAGADLVAIGPQTRLDDFQDQLHDIFGIQDPSNLVRTQQIRNSFRPTLVVEAGRTIGFGQAARLRPFAEARAGDESLLRIGADLTFGNLGVGELMVRESITGQRYRVIKAERSEISFVLGADIAHVFDSVYLPEDRGYVLTDTRERVRAGIDWQTDSLGLFYGLTWMGREFEAQPEAQLLGSIKLDIRF